MITVTFTNSHDGRETSMTFVKAETETDPNVQDDFIEAINRFVVSVSQTHNPELDWYVDCDFTTWQDAVLILSGLFEDVHDLVQDALSDDAWTRALCSAGNALDFHIESSVELSWLYDYPWEADTTIDQVATAWNNRKQ